jgi:prepilin-type N-terminal cleavage/methylation domain-containing protein
VSRRSGFSLLELLVAIGILAILVGLTLAAIQNARATAIRMRSCNNLRQIILGVQQFADLEEGRVRGLARQGINPNSGQWYDETTIFQMILPWTYGTRPAELPAGLSNEQVMDIIRPRVKAYMSPADPTLDFIPGLANDRQKCSYVANMRVFNGVMVFPISMPDGTSSTLAFTEHYYACLVPGPGSTVIHYQDIWDSDSSSHGGTSRRATFADKGWGDVMPVTDPATGRTVSSVPGLTFQYRPRIEDANWKVPQTPHAGGLPVALFDGSVRTLSPSINESVFWSLVTPNGGESVGDY